MKLFGVEGRLQRLQTDHVFELQVSRRSFTRAELLNELPEAETDPLPRHKVLILNVRSHVLREERLVTAKEQRGDHQIVCRTLLAAAGQRSQTNHLLWL